MWDKYVDVLISETNSVFLEIIPNLYKCVLLNMSRKKNKANTVELKQQVELYKW